MNLKETLKGKLPEKERSHIQKSFDILGGIAIIEVLDVLKKKEKLIAETLLKNHKNIKTVLKKVDRFKGRLRTRKLKFILGEKNMVADYHENGCRFKFNVETSYFSPRLSSDRLEIAKQVRRKEMILVMFSGVAPYPIVISKNSSPKEIYAIELNRKASKYARENVKLNKLTNVRIIQGNVTNIIPKLKKEKIIFDRIVMARPQLKDDFLRDAKKVSKKGTIIHFYDFLYEEEIPESIIKKIKKAFPKVKILKWKKAGDIGPRKFRVRIDFKVL